MWTGEKQFSHEVISNSCLYSHEGHESIEVVKRTRGEVERHAAKTEGSCACASSIGRVLFLL